MRTWSVEQENYLKEIYLDKSNEEIANLINDKFGTYYTRSSVSKKKVKLKLLSGYKYVPKYTEEIRIYVKENHKGKSTIELAKEVSDKFGIVVTPDNMQNLKSNIRRRENFTFEPARNDGCKEKGYVPFNKGLKWNEYLTKEQQEKAKTSCFKKGNISPNNVPIGTERISKDGYIEIKVKDGYLNRNWQGKHRYIYEQHYGLIPIGHKVIFADGNRRNFDINNLILVSNSEELIMNTNKLIYKDSELTKTGHLIAKVIDKTNKVKNERL